MVSFVVLIASEKALVRLKLGGVGAFEVGGLRGDAAIMMPMWKSSRAR